MKLALFLGLSVPALHAETLTINNGIDGFAFSWGNPDRGSDSESGPTDSSLMTDGVVTAGSGEMLTNPHPGVWGVAETNVLGMVGTFAATSLDPGAGNAYWDISRAAVVFTSDCFNSDTTVDFSYDAFSSNTRVIGSASGSSTNGIYTFEADITNGQDLPTVGALTFAVATNSYCEGTIEVLEFILEGIRVATPEPSTEPTDAPTTSAEPTMAPVAQCRGEITWGDPHFQLMAWISGNGAPAQFNFQGLGWYYYVFPCETELYENWPFFLLANHEDCYAPGKTCIENNRLVINTKPEPWIIDFTEKSVEITVGTDTVHSSNSDFGEDDFKNAGIISIDYRDGGSPEQSGTIKISYNGKAVVQLVDVAYHAYPRTCDKGTKSDLECGDYTCSGEVIDIQAQHWWTGYDCPTCLRNLACGISGKYTRGDCTKTDMRDPTSACYDVLHTSDGNTITPPEGDANFATFAVTWAKDYVDDLLVAQGYTVPDYLKSHGSNKNAPTFNKALEGRIRGLDFAADDSVFADTDCLGDLDRIEAVNATCKAHTVDRYDECCDRIGICDILWNSCVEDLCACTTVSDEWTMTEAQCLNEIVHSAMNATCTYDKLFPTATPTSAPTPSPTNLIQGLPSGTKAEDLIWVYLIFVVVFVLMAGGAFWYYKKKSKAIQSFDAQDAGDVEIAGTSHVQS